MISPTDHSSEEVVISPPLARTSSTLTSPRSRRLREAQFAFTAPESSDVYQPYLVGLPPDRLPPDVPLLDVDELTIDSDVARVNAEKRAALQKFRRKQLDVQSWLKTVGTLDSKHPLTPHQMQSMRTLYDMMDCDAGGSVEVDECTEALRSMGVSIDESDVFAILESNGKVDGDDEVSFHDFIDVMIRVVIPGLAPGQAESRHQIQPFSLCIPAFQRRSFLAAVEEGRLPDALVETVASQRQTQAPAYRAAQQRQEMLESMREVTGSECLLSAEKQVGRTADAGAHIRRTERASHLFLYRSHIEDPDGYIESRRQQRARRPVSLADVERRLHFERHVAQHKSVAPAIQRHGSIIGTGARRRASIVSLISQEEALEQAAEEADQAAAREAAIAAAEPIVTQRRHTAFGAPTPRLDNAAAHTLPVPVLDHYQIPLPTPVQSAIEAALQLPRIAALSDVQYDLDVLENVHLVATGRELNDALLVNDDLNRDASESEAQLPESESEEVSEDERELDRVDHELKIRAHNTELLTLADANGIKIEAPATSESRPETETVQWTSEPIQSAAAPINKSKRHIPPRREFRGVPAIVDAISVIAAATVAPPSPPPTDEAQPTLPRTVQVKKPTILKKKYTPAAAAAVERLSTTIFAQPIEVEVPAQLEQVTNETNAEDQARDKARLEEQQLRTEQRMRAEAVQETLRRAAPSATLASILEHVKPRASSPRQHAQSSLVPDLTQQTLLSEVSALIEMRKRNAIERRALMAHPERLIPAGTQLVPAQLDGMNESPLPSGRSSPDIFSKPLYDAPTRRLPNNLISAAPPESAVMTSSLGVAWRLATASSPNSDLNTSIISSAAAARRMRNALRNSGVPVSSTPPPVREVAELLRGSVKSGAMLPRVGTILPRLQTFAPKSPPISTQGHAFALQRRQTIARAGTSYVQTGLSGGAAAKAARLEADRSERRWRNNATPILVDHRPTSPLLRSARQGDHDSPTVMFRL